jgi:hypothetical protein
MCPTKPAVATSVLFLPVLNQLEPDIDNLPPSSAEVRNEWCSTSAACIRPHGLDRENFTLFALC